MTRISSAMLNANALQHLQRAQEDMFEAQRQSATQRKADDVKGYGRETKSLVTLQRMQARGESHLQTAQEVNLRLSLQDAQLGQAANVISDLKEKLTSALALNDLSEADSFISNAFSDLKSAFNATHNGKYMFSGTLTETAPIQAASLSELAANPLSDAVIQEGKEVDVRIDDARSVRAAPLAKDAAPEIFSILRDLKIFNDSADGPFDGNPTDLQESAIKTALADLETAFTNINTVQAQNGQAMNETDSIIERQQAENDLLENLTADITEVDLAEVAVKLNQAQLQFQASASIFNRIQSLSLVDYLS